MVWYVAHIGEMRKSYEILIGNLGRKRQLGRPRSRWENSIKTELGETKLGLCELDSCSSG